MLSCIILTIIEKHGLTNKVQTKLQKLNLVVTQSRLLIYSIPKEISQMGGNSNQQSNDESSTKFDVNSEKGKLKLDD